jgi:Uma2 family endonuclease
MSTESTRRVGRDRWQRVPATWGAYVRLLKARGGRKGPKYTYHAGRLTIVSPGYSHGEICSRLTWMTETMLVLLGLRFASPGEVTLKDVGSRDKGTEPDASYYLSPEKIERLKGRKRIRMGVDPAPDLALEVVVTHPVRDALEVLGAFGVREVWVCKGDRVRFLVLEEGGHYAESRTSAVLPFLTPEDLTPWVYSADYPEEMPLRLAFIQHVNEVLAPRYERAGNEEKP